MFRRLVFRGLVPAAFILAVLAASFLAPPRGSLGSNVYACTSYAYQCGVPAVTGVSPNSGLFSGGDTVTITGTDFNNSGVVVQFGSSTATTFTVDSDTQITAISPSHAIGLVDVFVTTSAGMSAANGGDKFTYTPCVPGPGGAPTVTGLSPNFGLTPGGTVVTITGCAFTAALRVKFGTVAAAGFTTVSDTTITATSPPGNVGTVGVRVATANGTSAFVPADQFTYTNGPCVSVSLTAAPPSPSVTGTPVAFTAAAAGCTHASPFYEFWQLIQGSWQIVQAYSTNTVFNWTSTGTPASTLQFGVWVKDASSLVAYDTFTSIPYTLSVPSCASVTLSAAPPSPQLSGTAITLTGAALGCPNPRYEFWAKWQGTSAWQLLRGYSGTATYIWNSTGALAGVENFGVWARDAASSAAYDTFIGATFTVTAPSCSGVTASALPTSVVSGAMTHVTITGAGTGCTTTPVYEFWMRAASQSSWQLVQSYSSSPTYDWNSTGAAPGTVYFGVWVRDAGSSAAYDVFISTSVAVT